jgi:hypothetical protein
MAWSVGRRIVATAGVSMLIACSTIGPPSITYSRADLEKQAFIDRREGSIGELFKGLEGANFKGPEVGIATAAGRIELAWTAKLASGPLGVPLNLSATISGIPELNAARDGIDLADTRVEEVKMPFIKLGSDKLKANAALGRVPLLTFDPAALNRDGVLYQAESVSLGSYGLRVNLARK